MNSRRFLILSFSLISASSGTAMLAILTKFVPNGLPIVATLLAPEIATFVALCVTQAVVGFSNAALFGRIQPDVGRARSASLLLAALITWTVVATVLGGFATAAILFLPANLVVIVCLLKVVREAEARH